VDCAVRASPDIQAQGPVSVSGRAWGHSGHGLWDEHHLHRAPARRVGVEDVRSIFMKGFVTLLLEMMWRLINTKWKTTSCCR
jgi:hypothetical protein